MANWYKDEFMISDDKQLLDVELIHQFLSTQSYWAKGIPIEVCKRSIEHSTCFGLYHNNNLIGFARIITDHATIAYMGDVFILSAYRNRGLGSWLMRTVKEYPSLQGLRRWILATADAHDLYSQIGFRPVAKPERWMELYNPDVYRKD